MPTASRLALSSLVALLVATGPLPAVCSDPDSPEPPSNGSSPPLLLGAAYPLEVAASFHVALLHWLDSLTHANGPGMTAGKTVEAHRQTYRRVLGEPTDGDLRRLHGYRDARMAFASHGGDALTLAFFESSSLEQAVARARALLDEEHAGAFADAMGHFAGPYHKIWRNGRIPNDFLRQARRDPRRRAVTRFLVDVAGFFGVEPTGGERPRIVLAPVRRGHGTHAQAIERFLLIEVRDGEGLLDQLAPIVHENAHFLYLRMPPGRLEVLREAARQAGSKGEAAWDLLHEALPTALAQGIADLRFNADRWSLDDRWYHVPEIDAYAKRIFPIVKQALADQALLDEALVRELVAAY